MESCCGTLLCCTPAAGITTKTLQGYTKLAGRHQVTNAPRHNGGIALPFVAVNCDVCVEAESLTRSKTHFVAKCNKVVCLNLLGLFSSRFHQLAFLGMLSLSKPEGRGEKVKAAALTQ